MSSAPLHHVFPPFRLDRANAQLWSGEEKIGLRPKTFEVLRYLVEHRGQLVTKAMLLDAVWPGVVVSDSMPATCVAELRGVLGDNARTPKFIETVHRRGYRFIAQVTTAAVHDMPSAPQPRSAAKQILVGREADLERLRGWYSDAVEGQRRVVFVAGEAGIGKTALVQAFLDSVPGDGGVRIARGQCVGQYGAGEPYMPVFEALTRLGKAFGGERVVETLRRFAPTWLAQIPALVSLEERTHLRSDVPGVTQQRMLREMTEALEALAAESPLVLLLEDLHWSDFSTLELISAIARRVESARLMLLGTYRPVEVLVKDHPLGMMKEELEIHRYCEELRLKLLQEADIAAYLAQRFSSGSQRYVRFAPVIHARTGGNPLFMISVVDYLIDEGVIMKSRGLQTTDVVITDGLEAPRSIRQMIERNFERLKPDEQAVLEGASVAGTEFSTASVAAALERPQDEIEACCIRLSRREQFVSTQEPVSWPDGTITAGFRFNHTLYQQVLYSRLPIGHRLQLHRRIAMRAEVGYGERSDEVATELAHHYSLANVRHKAIQYFELASARAVARGAMVEAEEHYRCALKLLGELPKTLERDREELGMQIALGSVLWTSKSWSHPEAGRAFTRAQELAEELGENAQLATVLQGLVLSALGSGHNRSALELAERMLKAAERGENRPSLCMAHSLLGNALFQRAQYADAQKHLELARGYYTASDPGGPGKWGITASATLAVTVMTLGYADRARLLGEEANDRAARCLDPLIVATVHMWLGWLCGLLRDATGALEHSLALRQMAEKHPVWSGLADFIAGKSLMIQGNWDRGADCMRKAAAFHNSVGLLALPRWFKLDETEYLQSKGQVADALALVADAVVDTEELTHLRSPTLLREANLFAHSGADISVIEASYRAALECTRVQGAKYHELQAATSFARWLNVNGRSDEARILLAAIHGWFTEGFDTPALKEARELLDELR